MLSIQSHVVRGYVGNKCATFPIQLHGIEVDAINSVQFSTHTCSSIALSIVASYGYLNNFAVYHPWAGEVMTSQQLSALYDALKANNLLSKYTHLLTGYCRDENFLSQIAAMLKEFRLLRPNFRYVCDPVLGDRGHYYVPESVMPIYRDTLMPLADVVVPNQFELGQLAGLPVETEAQALAAVDALHGRGNARVVVTSSELAPTDKEMYVYCSEHKNGAFYNSLTSQDDRIVVALLQVKQNASASQSSDCRPPLSAPVTRSPRCYSYGCIKPTTISR